MIRILTGLFIVVFSDQEDDHYNLLLQQYLGNTRSPDLVAAWVPDDKDFKAGKILRLTIKAECTQVWEVLEGNGKRGTAWRPEDDWYLNGRPYICNAIEVRIEKE